MNYFRLSFILLLLQLEVYACDCDSPPETFMTSISEYTAVFEVVQMDTLASKGAYRYQPFILTKLKVIKSFNSNIDVDYVWMNNTTSPDCELGLHPDYIGQKYIITGSFTEGKRYNKWVDDWADRHFFYASTCGKMALDVEGNNVYGVITKSNQKKIQEKYDRLQRIDESKASAYYKEIYETKHHPDLVQTIPLHEFYELMKHR
jgi:hypothetical protein